MDSEDAEAYRELLSFFEALSDVQRLKLFGRLADGEVYDLAALGQVPGLGGSALRRHLKVLIGAGLVRDSPRGLQVNTPRLAELARRVHQGRRAQATGSDRAVEPYLDAAGRLRQFPAHPARLRPVLRHLAGRFESGRRYAEREVNACLSEVTDDPMLLRRLLVDHGELARERDGSAYWRPDPA